MTPEQLQKANDLKARLDGAKAALEKLKNVGYIQKSDGFFGFDRAIPGGHLVSCPSITEFHSAWEALQEERIQQLQKEFDAL